MSMKTLTAAMATTAVLAGLGAAPAQAAPLPVRQAPLTATQVAGGFVPQPFTTRIGASTTPRRGEIRFTAHSSIGYNSYGSLVRIDFRNLRTGYRGSVTVKPFGQYQVPKSVLARTGTGRIAYTARFVNAGSTAVVVIPTPGSGSFFVP